MQNWGHTLGTQQTSKMGIKGGDGGLTLGCIIGGGGGGHRSALYNTIFLKFYTSSLY